MKKVIFIFLAMTIPALAWAVGLSTANDRAASSGDYLVTTGLTTQFGRMASSGDYKVGGSGTIDEGGGGLGNPTDSQYMIFIRRRRIHQ